MVVRDLGEEEVVGDMAIGDVVAQLCLSRRNDASNKH